MEEQSFANYSTFKGSSSPEVRAEWSALTNKEKALWSTKQKLYDEIGYECVSDVMTRYNDMIGYIDVKYRRQLPSSAISRLMGRLEESLALIIDEYEQFHDWEDGDKSKPFQTYKESELGLKRYSDSEAEEEDE
jgi:hypothetical protein